MTVWQLTKVDVAATRKATTALVCCECMSIGIDNYSPSSRPFGFLKIRISRSMKRGGCRMDGEQVQSADHIYKRCKLDMRSVLDACGFSAGSRVCVRRRRTQAMALSSVALVPEAPV